MRKPSEAIRQYHRQMINNALRALSETTMEEREMTGYSVPLRKKDIPEFKKMMRKFHREIARLAAKTNADNVYQFNVQLFPLTKQKK